MNLRMAAGAALVAVPILLLSAPDPALAEGDADECVDFVRIGAGSFVRHVARNNNCDGNVYYFLCTTVYPRKRDIWTICQEGWMLGRKSPRDDRTSKEFFFDQNNNATVNDEGTEFSTFDWGFYSDACEAHEACLAAADSHGVDRPSCTGMWNCQ